MRARYPPPERERRMTPTKRNAPLPRDELRQTREGRRGEMRLERASPVGDNSRHHRRLSPLPHLARQQEREEGDGLRSVSRRRRRSARRCGCGVGGRLRRRRRRRDLLRRPTVVVVVPRSPPPRVLRHPFAGALVAAHRLGLGSEERRDHYYYVLPPARVLAEVVLPVC